MRFTKVGKVRFTSHRDIARMWERAFRRTVIPVALTAGFSPRPRIGFGLALPTTGESIAEYLDVDLDEMVDLSGLELRLSEALPVGVDCVAIAQTPVSTHAAPVVTTSLQEAVESTTWMYEVPVSSAAALSQRISQILLAETLPVQIDRKGTRRTEDLRPALLAAVLGEPTPDSPLTAGHQPFVVAVRTKPRGYRPADVIAVFDPELSMARVTRMHQFLGAEFGGKEPLELDPTVTPAHVTERAELFRRMLPDVRTLLASRPIVDREQPADASTVDEQPDRLDTAVVV
jgi:radical SAM-linked protein